MIGKDFKKGDREFFKNLLHISSLRGPHSTGVMSATPFEKHDFTRLKKFAMNSVAFMQMDENNGKMLDSYWAQVFMGHCRWATIGDVTPENAHPFDTGNLISAHNGTLHDMWSWGERGETRTDSEIMFERMEKEGIEAVLKDVQNTSAYAISVWDKTKKTMTLARNKHRDLYVAINKERDVLYWASEACMLEFCEARNDVNIDIYELDPQRVYTININEIKAGYETPWDVYDIPLQPELTVSSRVQWGGVMTTDSDWDCDCGACGKTMTSAESLRATPVEYINNYGVQVKIWCCEECTQGAAEEVRSAKKELPANIDLIDTRGDVIVN